MAKCSQRPFFRFGIEINNRVIKSFLTEGAVNER